MSMASGALILPPVKRSPGIYEGQARAFEVAEECRPSDWAEANFHLVKGYANPGAQFSLYPWQRPIVDSILTYSTVILCGCTQFGKSMLAEIILWWLMACRPINALACYAKKETVEDVFQDRFRPALYEVPALRELWDGNPDSLTMKKLTLYQSIIRVASARIRDDIASHPSGHIYAAECAKYRDADYDVMKLLRGRQEAYNRTGNKSAVFESSPLEKRDPLHREMFRAGVLNLEWCWPCPVCGLYQQYDLHQIKELPNGDQKTDHDPERIRRDGAARYECKNCGNDVPETARIGMNERGVWAAKDEKIGSDGKVVTERRKTDSVSFHWSRLIDHSFTFAECLARFFEAQSGGIVTLKDFMNEDMAEFWSPTAEERPSSWLVNKCGGYAISDGTVPDEALVLICGMDTQDNGFFYVVRAYGPGMESWLLDCDFIACPMGQGEFADPQAVLGKVKTALSHRPYTKRGREVLEIQMGLVDRGGHRANFVDYIVARLPGFYAYIGSREAAHPLIRLGKDNIYWGNTCNLSRTVDKASLSDGWHIPTDVPADYVRQFVNQFDLEEIDRHGNKITKWITRRPDHYRDAENLAQGAALALQLSETLCNEESLAELAGNSDPNKMVDKKEKPQEENAFFAGIQERYNRRRW